MDKDQPSIIALRDQDYPMVGETLGLWRLVRGLGRGGMGEVYEAEYDYLHLLTLRYPPDQRDMIRQELTQLARKDQAVLAQEMLGTSLPPEARFAIKICNARSGTPGHRRFLQEAELAQRLGDHPYIVSVLAVNGGGLDDNGPARRLDLDRGKYRDVAFMVMDLAIRTYDHTQLSLPEAVHVVRCIASALDHAHRHGIIHRDLKPENILGSVEHPLLTDFGIAKEMDQTDGLTRTGQIIGTLDYMSPEQATDAKRVDHRSDIYSLGVVLYETATKGCLPYSHKLDRESCLAAIRSERNEPRWPREYRADFPVDLERIILKAMSQRMEDRYQGMSELITDLDRYSRGERIGFLGRVQVKNWGRFQLRRRPKLAWSLGVAATIVVLGLLILLVSELLDDHRRDLRRKLDRFERVESELEGAKNQPNQDEFKLLADIEGNLQYLGDRYPEERQRRDDMRARFFKSRRFTAAFLGKDGKSLSATDWQKAKEQFSLAIGREVSSWTVPDAESGLWVQNDVRVPLGLFSPSFGIFSQPFGLGTCYAQAVVRTSDGFALSIREDKETPKHLTTLALVGDQVLLTTREDDKAPLTLFTQSLPAGGPLFPLSFSLEVSPTSIRLWWNSPGGGLESKVFTGVRGLREGAHAVVELQLPRNTRLRSIEVWPKGPR